LDSSIHKLRTLEAKFSAHVRWIEILLIFFLTKSLIADIMYANNTMAKQTFELGFLLNRASFALARYLNRSFSSNGLRGFSSSYLGVLNCLWEKDAQTLSELGGRIGLEASSMTGLIDRMEKAKLVSRKSDPRDRRVWRVSLTEKGRMLQPQISAIFEQAYQDLTKGIALEELVVVKNSLKKFIKNTGRTGLSAPGR